MALRRVGSRLVQAFHCSMRLLLLVLVGLVVTGMRSLHADSLGSEGLTASYDRRNQVAASAGSRISNAADESSGLRETRPS